MDINKISPGLQLALRYETLISASEKAIFQTTDPNRWQIVVMYVQNIDDIVSSLGAEVVKVGTTFMVITISKEKINELSTYAQVTLLSLPSEMSYTDIGLSAVCGTNISLPTSQFNVTGSNILIGIIDSGIQYRQSDFRNEDGTTRIKYLWDQTLEGSPPEGFNRGVEYSEEVINTALRASSEADQLAIVPSQDTLGHGTALASIAAGNNRSNQGVAPESNLIIVKIGTPQLGSSRPRDMDIMEGISYVLAKATQLRQPISIILGVGDNLTGHDGQTPLELYIDEAIYEWACNFSVGAGNEGDKNSHTKGVLIEGQTTTLEFILQGNLMTYGFCLWKTFIDEIEMVIEAPNGERTDVLSTQTSNRAYLFDNTSVLINFTEPAINIKRQEVFIWLQAQPGQTINTGQWRFIITPKRILDGRYDMWAQITDTGSGFLNASIEATVTSPGNSKNITTVGAINASTTALATFSGRGYTLDGRIKPDLVAPGVDIPVVSNTDDTSFSGTSAAAAFVGGAYALLLSYGIYELNQRSFYGLRLTSYLLRNALRPESYGPFPNRSWGYGILCLEATLSNMLDVTISTT